LFHEEMMFTQLVEDDADML
jgi:hypothetical protein